MNLSNLPKKLLDSFKRLKNNNSEVSGKDLFPKPLRPLTTNLYLLDFGPAASIDKLVSAQKNYFEYQDEIYQNGIKFRSEYFTYCNSLKQLIELKPSVDPALVHYCMSQLNEVLPYFLDDKDLLKINLDELSSFNF